MSDMPWIAPTRPDLTWFSGDDALRFLNDLVSQELANLADGSARRSLLLEPQGKLQFVMWALRDEGRIGLLTEPGRGDDLEATLNRYRIRVDVEITPESRELWVVVGEWEGFDISWAGVERHLVIGEKPELDQGTTEEYERLRITAGEPMWGVDVDERTIPHVSGLVPASVDFDKGCFLGQELVARIDSRSGNTPTNLLLVETGQEISPGQVVRVDGEEVGKVTSATSGIGLATLKRSVSAGDTVDLGGGSGTVRALPVKSQ